MTSAFWALRSAEETDKISELSTAIGNLTKTNGELEHRLADLHSAQEQIIASEKMAVPGQLMTSIARELNNRFKHGTSIQRYLNCTDPAIGFRDRLNRLCDGGSH